MRWIVRALRLNSRAIEREVGISLAQLWVLHLLSERPADSLGDLAGATAMHQSSVSVVVGRLVDRAFVIRTPARDDKRKVRIELTEAGRSVLRHAPATTQMALTKGLCCMTPEHRTHLRELMREWLTASGIEMDSPPPMLMEDEPDANARDRRIRKEA